MLDGFADARTITFDDGELQFRPTSLMQTIDIPADAEIRRLAAEQSNSSWIVGDTLVLKLVRRVLAGVHPEGEMTRFLTEHGFANTAPLFGELVRVDDDGLPHTVALAQGFVRNQGDAWVWTLDFLARQIEEVATTGDTGTAAESDVFSGYQSFASNIGKRLGELHALLAQPSDQPDFAPELADPVLADWADGAIEQIDMAILLLSRMTDWPDEATQAKAQLLIDNADRLRDAARRLAQGGVGALQTRVHGDFHLGQVLVVQGDAFIIDFEGEPARTMAQRRSKSSPLRDVAGLLRSLDYAAAAAAPGRVAASEQASLRRQSELQRWLARASETFMEAYQTVLNAAEPRWVSTTSEAALLDLFLLEKAAYEIKYEVTNRPAWIGIPLGGMYTIAARLLDLGRPRMSAEIAALVEGRHGDPFALLGPHGEEIRAFLPEADTVDVIDPTGREIASLERVHGGGFFAGPAHPNGAYRLRVGSHGHTFETEDPYRFGSTLGDLDLHLLTEGRHLDLGLVLGAHVATYDGVKGVRFAVWAPNAQRVSVVGDFNHWNPARHPMRKHLGAGVWDIFIPGIEPGAIYKYDMLGQYGERLPQKADPIAWRAELPPATGSIVAAPLDFAWSDGGWLARRAAAHSIHAPISVYEVHAASWSPAAEQGDIGWDKLADTLVPYVAGLGFTHLELMPIAEHPFGGSWGYQPLGQYAPSSRLGPPDGFARFVDRCHAMDVGVLLDWVPAHFPTDAHGMARFDGTPLYEHADPREGFHIDWNTLIFNLGRNEVRNFLIGSAVFWLEHYHVDGLRVDAVASMLYRDYSRKQGEWVPNVHGGRENLESVAFLQEMSRVVEQRCPGAVLIAEESTAWPGVTKPASEGGLGFHFKWNMGWMHDTLHYMEEQPVYRRWHHGEILFGLVYAFTERFMLPLSHDEVVYGKHSLIGKMPGDEWQRFANLRAYYGLMWTYPGKKLLFMGCEFAQEREWNHDRGLDWFLLDHPHNSGVQKLVRDLNALYRDIPALHDGDCDPAGFRWVVMEDAENSVFAYLRQSIAGSPPALVVCNMTPIPRYNYRLGVPHGGGWTERLNTDAAAYGGSNVGNGGDVWAHDQASHGFPASLTLTLPPLATIVLLPR